MRIRIRMVMNLWWSAIAVVVAVVAVAVVADAASVEAGASVMFFHCPVNDLTVKSPPFVVCFN